MSKKVLLLTFTAGAVAGLVAGSVSLLGQLIGIESGDGLLAVAIGAGIGAGIGFTFLYKRNAGSS